MTYNNDEVGGFGIQQLRERAHEKTGYYVDKLIPDRGLTLFAGESGIGKSTVILSLICAMMSGGDGLNRLRTRPAKVQIFTEDDETVLTPYLERIGAHYPGMRTDLVNFQPEVFEQHEFERKVIAYKPDLVIIDPIMMLADISNENDNTQVKKYLYPLKKWIRGQGATIIMTRHLKKRDVQVQDSQDTVFERVLGAQAWRSVPYHRIIMWKDQYGRFRLTCYSKYTGDFDWVLNFDKDTGLITVDDGEEITPSNVSSYRKPILRVLEMAPETYMAPQAIRDLIVNGGHMKRVDINDHALRAELRNMAERNIINEHKEEGRRTEYRLLQSLAEKVYPSPVDISDDAAPGDDVRHVAFN